MESYGAKLLFQQLKDAGLNITGLVADGDSSSVSQLESLFPNAKILRCIDHAARTLRRVLRNGSAAVKRIANKVANAFKTAVKKAEGSEVKFQELISQMKSHFNGTHTYCKSHGPDLHPWSKKPKDIQYVMVL